MSLAGLESYLSEHIEGFFNKRLAGNTEPSELVRELAREVSRQKRQTDGQIFAPNEYDILLPADDYGRLSSQRIISLLTKTVRREIVRQDRFLSEELRVTLKKDTAAAGGFSLVSRFTDGNEDAPPSAESEDTEEHTIVLERHKFKNPLNLPVEEKFVSLSVIDGADKGAYWEFGAKKIFVGRLERNDFLLTDDSVSRIHASLAYRNGRHFVQDEKSANGVWVRGEKVTQPFCLKNGDEMRFGETTVRYEVM